MTIEIALYQPDIAQNTGTLLRLGACFGIMVHVIHPTGFIFSRQTLKRSGLDYLDHAAWTEHTTFAEFDAARLAAGRRLVLLSTKASLSAYAIRYRPNDILLLGRESAGVPDAVAARADEKVRIPMQPGLRSINVAIAASLVLGESLRQTAHFETLS